MRFKREAIISSAVGALVLVACQQDPVPTAAPAAAPTRAAEPTATPAAAPTSAAVVAPTAEPTTPPPPLIQEPTPSAVPPTLTPAPASTRADGPQPTPTSIPDPTPSVGPTTPTAVPSPTLLPIATPTPAPVVEACREEYTAPIVSGPSEPNLLHDNDSVFRPLTVDPADPDIGVLGTAGNGFLRTTDGGANWSRHRAGLRSTEGMYPEIWDIDISASNSSAFMAATLDSPGPPTGFRGYPGLYRSTDGGQSWKQFNCGFTSSRVNSIRINPANPDVAVAGLEGGEPSFTDRVSAAYYGGGYRTEDGGDNWSRVDGIEGGDRVGYWIMRAVPEDPSQLVTSGMNYYDLSENLGFMRGTNAGQDWELVGPEMRHKYIANFDISADGQVIYASERDVYYGWVSRDGGRTWSRTDELNINGPIAVSSADPHLVIYASFDQLWRSTDGLQTASPVMNTDNQVREIVFAPSDPNVVYVETDGYILYRSNDAGITWKQLVHGREEVLNVQP